MIPLHGKRINSTRVGLGRNGCYGEETEELMTVIVTRYWLLTAALTFALLAASTNAIALPIGCDRPGGF